MARIDRVNEEVRHVLATAIGSVKDPRVSGMVSILFVDTSSDFKLAKVYLSVLDEKHADSVLKGMRSAAGFLRRELGRKLGLRNTPELQFFIDNSIKHGAHINDLLQSIKLDAPLEGENQDDDADADDL